MPLRHQNLDTLTRHFMMAEVELDIEAGCLTYSNVLTDQGIRDWPDLLRTATATGNDVTLTKDLRSHSRTRNICRRTKVNGDFHWVRVTPAQVTKLANATFNHFYVRGLCRRALFEELEELVVYRAAQVDTPRPGANRKVGSLVEPAGVLERLKSGQCLEAALGLPDKPHSGLSLAINDPSRSPTQAVRPTSLRPNLYDR